MQQTYPFELMPLPYSYDALEPYMDAETLHYHHDKHLKTYIDNLNKILKDYPQYHDWTLEDILKNLDEFPEDIRQTVMNNAGGVYNHQMFFEGMHAPVNENPMQKLLADAFGSYEKFVESMMDHAMSQFGSGYAWLVINPDKQLEILNTPNQNVQRQYSAAQRGCLGTRLLSEIQKSQKSLCHQLVPSDRLEGCMAESPGKHELNYKRRISRQDILLFTF